MPKDKNSFGENIRILLVRVYKVSGKWYHGYVLCIMVVGGRRTKWKSMTGGVEIKANGRKEGQTKMSNNQRKKNGKKQLIEARDEREWAERKEE